MIERLERPLSFGQTGLAVALAVALMLLFCASHAALYDRQFWPVASTAWALASAAPLAFAFEFVKRQQSRGLRNLRGTFLLGAAVVLAVTIIATCLTLLVQRISFGAWAPPLEVAHARIPYVLGVVALAFALQSRPLSRRAILYAPAAPIPQPRVEAAPPAPPAPPAPARAHVELPDGRILDLATTGWARAAANYAEISGAAGLLLCRTTMAQLEKMLTPHGFVRIHRSTIVNWRKVTSVNSETVRLENGERFSIGRKYRDRLPPLAA